MRRSVELSQICAFFLHVHVRTLWSSPFHSHSWSRWQPWPLYICASVSDLICVWSGCCIFMWLCGHLVWQAVCFKIEWSLKGKGCLAACCLSDSISPISVLTHMFLIVPRTFLPSYQINIRILLEDFKFYLKQLLPCLSCRILSDQQTPRTVGSWRPNKQTGLRVARSPGQQQRCTCQLENISKPSIL